MQWASIIQKSPFETLFGEHSHRASLLHVYTKMQQQPKVNWEHFFLQKSGKYKFVLTDIHVCNELASFKIHYLRPLSADYSHHAHTGHLLHLYIRLKQQPKLKSITSFLKKKYGNAKWCRTIHLCVQHVSIILKSPFGTPFCGMIIPIRGTSAMCT